MAMLISPGNKETNETETKREAELSAGVNHSH
jgi:hypothetical protein